MTIDNITKQRTKAMGSETISDRMRRKLTAAFAPVRMEIINESAHHIGHSGYANGGESHFQVVIVSEAFAGLGKLARHRAVYDALAEEMADGIHALALELKTPEEG
jgi:BolA protein